MCPYPPCQTRNDIGTSSLTKSGAMMRAFVVIVAVSLALSGCARTPYTLQTQFDDGQMAWSKAQGAGTIKGQGFLKTVGGDVKTCAGSEAFLVPNNAYTQEMITGALKGGSLANRDERMSNYVRKTRCDAQGNFTFKSLPPGNWMVFTTATWGVPNGYFVSRQGGMVLNELVLADAETKEVILTR